MTGARSIRAPALPFDVHEAKDVNETAGRPIASWRVTAIVTFHAGLAAVATIFVFRATMAGVGALSDPSGTRTFAAATEFAGAAVALLLLVAQLLLISGLRKGSQIAWWADVSFGALALFVLLGLWLYSGLPTGAGLVVQIGLFGCPIAAAGLLMSRPVRAQFFERIA